ncbi:MAG: flagellar protein FlaG [Deltaproteobacteria bacterium]|nr:flagellar protein FlaG [Deltaproteobacteria bacterium]
MGNFTTGAYGSIPIVISPRGVDHQVIKEASPSVRTDTSTDEESRGWRESLMAEKLRREEIDTNAKSVTREDLDDAFDSLESAALIQGRTLKFEEDQESGISIVKIFDANSGELIRQVPPDEIVKMARKLKDFGRGWVDSVG